MIFNKIIFKPDITLFDILISILIFLVIIFIAKIISIIIRRTTKNRFSKEISTLLSRLAYYGIIITSAVSILSYHGVNLSGFMVAGGVAGIVLGFASQSIVGNLISGFFLITERPIKIGSQINSNGINGFVEDISIISTIIRTYDGLYVRIPNEKVFTSNITNFGGNKVRRYEFTLTIDINEDFKKCKEILELLFYNEPYILVNPPSEISIKQFKDFSLELIIKIWTPIEEWYSVSGTLPEKIKSVFQENGIKLAYPITRNFIENEVEIIIKK
jgi:small-conductance mechanosensitive channel